MVSRWRADQNKPCVSSSAATTLSQTMMVAKAMVLPQTVSSRNAFRNKFFSLFVESGLSVINSVHFACGDRNDWMLQVIELPSMTEALENALLAVCTARLGRHADRFALVHESLDLYAKATSELRRDIRHTSRRKDEQCLAACLALLLYETLECPAGTSDGYQAHYWGNMELLQMRGARAHTSGLAHSTFQVLRLHSVST